MIIKEVIALMGIVEETCRSVIHCQEARSTTPSNMLIEQLNNCKPTEDVSPVILLTPGDVNQQNIRS